MTAAPPKLLVTEKEARALLSGADPAQFTPPIIMGRRRFYSMAALDDGVRRRAGLSPEGADANGANPQTAYDAWRRESA